MTQINNVIGIEVRRRLMDIEDLKHLSAEAQQRSLSAEEMARLAELLSKSTKAELDQIVIEGDSSVEAAQARVDAKGEPHDTLKARLDYEWKNTDEKLVKTMKDIEQRGINLTSYAHLIPNLEDDYDEWDWSDALQQAINDAPIEGWRIILPPYLMRITKSIIFKIVGSRVVPVILEGQNSNQGSVSLSGNNRGMTKFIYTGNGTLFDLRADEELESRVGFRDFTAVCVSESKEGTIGINAHDFLGGELSNVAFYGFENNLVFRNIYYSKFKNITSRNALENGLYVQLVNGTPFEECQFAGNDVGVYLYSSGRNVSFDNCWIEANRIGVRSERTRQINMFGGYLEHHTEYSIYLGSSPHIDIPAVLNLYGTTLAVDDEAEAGIRAVVSSKTKINLYGVMYANRSDNAEHLIKAGGGTVTYLPVVTVVDVSCYDGDELDICPDHYDSVDISDGSIKVDNKKMMALVSDENDTGVVTPKHTMSVGSSRQSQSSGDMSQVNASNKSFAKGITSQVNASTESEASGARSQVNASDSSEVA